MAARANSQIDVASEIGLELGGNPIRSNLLNTFQRKLAENAALVAAGQAGERIENLWQES